MTGLQRTLRVVLLSALVITCIWSGQVWAAVQSSPAEASATPIDLILIVDTSATMIGKAGGQNIFPQVKKALKELVDSCGSGDNVILIPYDSDVRAGATSVVYDQQDKDAIRAEIESMKAAGLWTYTAAAIQKGLEEARRLDELQGSKKHPKVVVLLTDGLNDPPPSVRGTASEVHLSEVARRFQGMPWFVWQVQLGPRIDNAVDGAFHAAGLPNYRQVQTAAADLNKVRADILREAEAEKARQVAERAEEAKRKGVAKADDAARVAAEQAQEREHLQAQTRLEAARRAAQRKLILAGALLTGLALVTVGIVLWRRLPKPHGSLQYWRPGETPRTFDIGASGKRRLRLGPTTGDLVLEGLGERGLTLSATRVEGQILCVVEADDEVDLAFRGKPVNRLELYDRDQFQFADYRLQYDGEIGSRIE